MERKECIANRENYGGRRDTKDIQWIVVHYTANDGDSDENNGKYFQRAIVNASSHLFVDNDSVTQSVPDEFTAWSVGGTKYNNTKGGSLYGVCTNYNSISVELCDNVKDGVIYPTANTIINAIQVVSELMAKYNIPASHVIRHYDVTGKICPAYWVDDAKWEAEFHSKLPGAVAPEPTPAPQPEPVVNNGRTQNLGKVDVFAMAKTDRWWPEVKNQDDWAGAGDDKPITAVALRASAGSVKYQVHLKGRGWLPFVTGYDKNDFNNGYAGDGRTPIDAIRAVFLTPDGYIYKYLHYRVSAEGNSGFYSEQIDDQTSNGQDGYAGCLGKFIDKVQFWIP